MKFKHLVESYKSFWPYYLDQHKDPRNRAFHYVGTAFVLLSFSFFIMSGDFLFLFAMPVVGYFFAWSGHFLFEKNKPATFKAPLWSFLADFRMFFIFLRNSFWSIVSSSK